MKNNLFRILSIFIVSTIIIAGLVFLVWNSISGAPASFYVDERENGTQVGDVIAEQKSIIQENQVVAQNQTLVASLSIATATPHSTFTQIAGENYSRPLSATPTITQSEIPDQNPTSTAIPSSTWTPTPTGINNPAPTAIPFLSPTWTPVPSATNTSIPMSTATPIPTNTWTPVPARISGRLLLDGVPIEENVQLILEDQSFNQIAETIVASNGIYTYYDVPTNLDGYNILFSQDQNDNLGVYEVVSWGWLGPIIVQDGAAIDLPDFDIGLQGFEYTNPTPDSQIPITSITENSPITFQWTGYPYAGTYWVTLLDGDNLNEVWKSGLITNLSVNFNGTLNDSSKIQAGQYWWGVGFQGTLGDYNITAFGFLDGFTVTP